MHCGSKQLHWNAPFSRQRCYSHAVKKKEKKVDKDSVAFLNRPEFLYFRPKNNNVSFHYHSKNQKRNWQRCTIPLKSSISGCVHGKAGGLVTVVRRASYEVLWLVCSRPALLLIKINKWEKNEWPVYWQNLNSMTVKLGYVSPRLSKIQIFGLGLLNAIRSVG